MELTLFVFIYKVTWCKEVHLVRWIVTMLISKSSYCTYLLQRRCEEERHNKELLSLYWHAVNLRSDRMTSYHGESGVREHSIAPWIMGRYTCIEKGSRFMCSNSQEYSRFGVETGVLESYHLKLEQSILEDVLNTHEFSNWFGEAESLWFLRRAFGVENLGQKFPAKAFFSWCLIDQKEEKEYSVKKFACIYQNELWAGCWGAEPFLPGNAM